MSPRVEAGEADLRDLFEKDEEPTDADEERGREANEKQLKQLSTATSKLKSLHRRIEDLEERLKERPKPILKAKLEKSQVRLTNRRIARISIRSRVTPPSRLWAVSERAKGE